MKKRRPAKMSTASRPPRGREKGTQGRANLNKAAQTPGGQGMNAKDKMAKHAGKQKVAGRRTAAQAQREEAAPSENTQQTNQKHDPSHDVEGHTEGRATPKKPPAPTAGKGDGMRRPQSSPANRRAKGEEPPRERKIQQLGKHKHDPS